ncbi:MAG: HEPN domain-containing protein [Sedimentisphaerales bacterium]|nr:HEPN domain-containing protein [Sedimentisphaerales bacterium]
MHVNDQRFAIAREWIIKAENDLKNATHTLKMSRGCPTDTVCFHAQQCVEKYLKAFLVFKGIDFPRTHDIEQLVSLLPENIWLRLSIKEQRCLTAYATVTRYPGEYEPIPMDEARQGVKLARRVRKELRDILPKEILSVRRK